MLSIVHRKQIQEEEEMNDKETIEDTLLHPGVVDEEEETEKEEEE